MNTFVPNFILLLVVHSFTSKLQPYKKPNKTKNSILFTVKKKKERKAKMKRKSLILLVTVSGRWGIYGYLFTVKLCTPGSFQEACRTLQPSHLTGVLLTCLLSEAVGSTLQGRLPSLTQVTGEMQELNVNSHPMALTVSSDDTGLLPATLPIRFFFVADSLLFLIHLMWLSLSSVLSADWSMHWKQFSMVFTLSFP